MKMKVWRVLALVISAIAAISIISTVVTFVYAIFAYPNSWATTNPEYMQLAVANPKLYTYIVCSIITALISSAVAYKMVKSYNKKMDAKKRGWGVN